jgi:cell division protein FtsB
VATSILYLVILKVMKLPEFRFTGTNIFNVLGAIVILYLFVMLGQTIKNNYGLGQQISQLKSQISLLEEQKKELSYDIAYYNTTAYQDREARAELGLQAPGENVIIIPSDSPAPTPSPTTSISTRKASKSNPSQWIDFLSGKI